MTIFGFNFDFDAFTSIQWVAWQGIMSDALHFAMENVILWQNKGFVMTWHTPRTSDYPNHPKNASTWNLI